MTDQEILSQILESQNKVRRELREELENLFKKEKENFLERGQLFMNVAKWSAAALAVVFGLLGIKAWSDIKTNVEDYFKKKLETIYRIDDPISPLTRSIDELVDRAVVNALYLQVQRKRAAANSDKRSFRRDDDAELLTSGELDRLVKLVRSPKTEANTFDSAIFVLNELVSSEERRQPVSITLAELLAANPKSDAVWMSSNERKRLAILLSFWRSEAVDAVASELLSQPVSDRIKSAALSRVRKTNYKAAVPPLLKFIDATEENNLKFEGYLTLARLRPDHERTRRFILDDLMTKTGRKDLLRCLDMASALVASTTHDPHLFFTFEDPDDSEKRRRMLKELALPLAAKAIESGVTIHNGRYIGIGQDKGLFAKIFLTENSYSTSKIDNSFLSDDFVSELLTSAADKSTQILARYLSALMPDSSSNNSESHIRINVRLNHNSELQLEDGTIIRIANVKNESVELMPRAKNEDKVSSDGVNAKKQGSKQRSNERIILATWEDTSGKRFEKQLKSIRNVNFEARTNLGIQSDDESE